MKKIIQLICICIAVATLGACSSAIKVNLDSAAQLNPDSLQQPLPVLVRVYELSGKERFMQASFDSLWKHDADTLGNTLINKREVMINPQSTISVSLHHDDKTQYVGVMALFRKPGDKSWRSIKKIKSGMNVLSPTVTVKLTGSRLKLS